MQYTLNCQHPTQRNPPLPPPSPGPTPRMVSVFPVISSHGIPDILNESIPLCQPVELVVALAHRPHEAAQSIGVVLALDSTACIVNLCNGYLDRSMILRLYDTVGGAALAGNIAE